MNRYRIASRRSARLIGKKRTYAVEALEARWALTGTPPVADIVDIVPDPRSGAVDSVKIVFSEAVTGFDLSDLKLDRAYDGLGSRFTGAETLTTTDNITWSLGNLTAATTGGGQYYLSVWPFGAGIRNSAGTLMAEAANETWLNAVGDVEPPQVDIVDVAPDPRTSAVDTVQIVFSEPITGFELKDLRLTKDGVDVLSSAQTLTTADQKTWTLGNLAGLTNGPGLYTVQLKPEPTGIKDAGGNILINNVAGQPVSDTWTWPRLPLAADIIDVTPDPRTTPVNTITVVFNQPIPKFTWQDLDLQCSDDDLGNLITSEQQPTTSDHITWTIGKFGDLTDVDGLYQLRVFGSLATETWTNNENDFSPLTADIVDVSPDPRLTPVDSVSIVFSAPVTGFGLSDLVLTYQGNTANALTKSQTLTTSDNIVWTLGNLGAVTAANGNYELRIRPGANGIEDASGNPLNNPRNNLIRDAWRKESAQLLDVVDVSPDPRTTPVSSITIVFNGPLPEFSLGDLYLERIGDGLPNILTSAQTLTTLDNVTWVLGNLAPITGGGGTYQLRYAGQLVETWFNSSATLAADQYFAGFAIAAEGEDLSSGDA